MKVMCEKLKFCDREPDSPNSRLNVMRAFLNDFNKQLIARRKEECQLNR